MNPDMRDTWVPLDDEAQRDYLDGHLIPLEVRETEHGVEAYMPHDLRIGRWTGTQTCPRCGLLPLDYDAIETPCEREE